jgi:hypothetical protein
LPSMVSLVFLFVFFLVALENSKSLITLAGVA